MEYRLYHDESKVDGYWHGMLLVPERHRELMYSELMEMRAASKFEAPLGLKGISRASSRVGRLANNWLHYAIATMARPSKRPTAYKVGYKEYRLLKEPMDVKFILFRKDGHHRDMRYLPDDASRVETTIRMGLKGGLHALFDDKSPIHITQLHFDGHAHYQRNLDQHRIIRQLRGLREYCSIATGPEIIFDGSSDHDRPDAQAHIDCQFLQLTDLLIGGFRTLLGSATNPQHRLVARPVSELLERYQAGPARMRYSRWYGSFWMSQCELIDDTWRFSALEYRNEVFNSGQISLEL